MVKRPIGRPMRYKHILKALEEDSLYSPSLIVRFADKEGLPRTDPGDAEARTKERLRLRITMGRLSNGHQFPDGGDGPVAIPGQRPVPGWYGWRWQTTLYQDRPAPSDQETKSDARAVGAQTSGEPK